MSSPLRRDVIATVGLLVLSVWIWYYSGRFPDLPEGYPGPELFPRLIALGLGCVGIGIGLTRLLNLSVPSTHSAQPGEHKSGSRLVAGLLLLAVFPLLSPLLGFIPSLLIIGVLIGLSLRLRWWKAILTVATTVLGIYLIFSHLLNVPL